jgi:predicted small lipoprotein YifL
MIHPAAHRATRSGLVLIGALIALVVAGGTLTACGQKGNLYLPSQKKSKLPPSQQPPSQQPPDNQPQDSQPPGTTPPSSTAPAAS